MRGDRFRERLELSRRVGLELSRRVKSLGNDVRTYLMADCAFRTFSACTAVTFRGPTDARFPDPRNVSWGHASAHQLRRVLVGPDGEPVDVVNYVQSLGQCEIRCATGTSAYPAYPCNGDVRCFDVEWAVAGGLRASRAKNPEEVWDVSRSSRVAIYRGVV